jgi:hypothetical protein
MQAINAQSIINQLAQLAITASEGDICGPVNFVTVRTSERGSVRLRNLRSNIEAYAARVRKNAAAFGGGLIKKPKAGPAIIWPAGSVKLVAEMLEDGDKAGAATLAIQKCGALFFMWGSTPFMAWAPQAVEGLPDCLASVRSSCAENKWQVIHTETGRKLGDNFSSRKAAEQSALDAWANKLNDAQRAQVPAMSKDHSTEQARAQYLAAAGITTTEDLQADPAPVRKAAKATAVAVIESATEIAAVAAVVAIAQAQASSAADQVAAEATQAETEALPELVTAEAEADTVATVAQANYSAPLKTLTQAPAGHCMASLKTPAADLRHEFGRASVQRSAGRSGAWSAGLFRSDSGRAALMFVGRDGAHHFSDYETGSERMRALQAMARQAEAEAARTAADGGHGLQNEAQPRSQSQGQSQPQPHDHDQAHAHDQAAECEERNDHGGALMWRCIAAGRHDLAERVRACNTRQDQAGYLTPEIGRARDTIAQELRDYMGSLKTQGANTPSDYMDPLKTLPAVAGFERARPLRVDLRLLLKGGMSMGQLVGLGVNYSGDRANPARTGAIVSAEPCKYYGVRVGLAFEDGSEWATDARSFGDSPGNRYALNWKYHGAPYLAQLQAAQAAKKASESSAKERAQHAHAQDLARLSVEFAHLERAEGKHHGGLMAARNIRTVLKHAFKTAYPAVKFSVKSDYSSCSVSWTDGPSQDAVDALLAPFDIGRSDAQNDYFYTEGTAFSELFGGVQYLNTKRDCSPAMVQAAIDAEFADYSEKPTVQDWEKATGMLDHHHNLRSRIYGCLRAMSAPTHAKA